MQTHATVVGMIERDAIVTNVEGIHRHEDACDSMGWLRLVGSLNL